MDLAQAKDHFVYVARESDLGDPRIIEIWSYWVQKLGNKRAKPTEKRLSKIVARLKQKYTVEQLKIAIDGCACSPYHQGENTQGKTYKDLTLIFRNGDKVEQFIGYAEAKKKKEKEQQLSKAGNQEKQKSRSSIFEAARSRSNSHEEEFEL